MTLEDLEEVWQQHVNIGIQQHDSELELVESRPPNVAAMDLAVFLRAFDDLAQVKYASHNRRGKGGAGSFNRLLLRDVFRDISTSNVGFVRQRSYICPWLLFVVACRPARRPTLCNIAYVCVLEVDGRMYRTVVR